MDQYIGKMLDNRYEILERIGTGGMAVVYKAKCHRLNRLVAVKILKSDLAQDEDFRRRFNAEAAAVAQLIGEKEPGKTIPIEYGDGLRECRKMLMLAKVGKYNGYLLEGMGCPGGCVAGAGTIRPVKTAANRVAAYQAAATRKSPLEDPERDMLEKIQE